MDYDPKDPRTPWEQQPEPRQHDRAPGVRVKPEPPRKRTQDQILGLLLDDVSRFTGEERMRLLDEMRGAECK